jgi:hypothetical protein
MTANLVKEFLVQLAVGVLNQRLSVTIGNIPPAQLAVRFIYVISVARVIYWARDKVSPGQPVTIIDFYLSPTHNSFKDLLVVLTGRLAAMVLAGDADPFAFDIKLAGYAIALHAAILAAVLVFGVLATDGLDIYTWKVTTAHVVIAYAVILYFSAEATAIGPVPGGGGNVIAYLLYAAATLLVIVATRPFL